MPYAYRFSSSIVALSAVLLTAPLSWADPPDPTVSPLPAPPPLAPAAPPTPTPTPAPTLAPAAVGESDPLFRVHYTDARTRLITGDFAGAEQEFEAAAQAALNPVDRLVAEEQRAIAHEWAARGLTLVERRRVGENATARSVDLRTSDEIVSLYTNAVLYGVGTGIWVDEVAGASSTTAVVVPLLLFGGAAVGTVAVLDRGRGLRYGVAQSMVSGMYIGLEEGIAWTLFRAEDPTSSMSAGAAATVVWGSTTAGIVAGGILASEISTTPGRAAWVGSTSLWAGVLSGLTAGAFSTDPTARPPLFASAVALNAGAIAGLLTAGPVSPSIAHVRFLDLGGISGAIVGGGIYLAAANNRFSGQAFAGTAALGTAVGLTVAWFATRSMARDEGATKEEPTTAGIVWNPTVMPAKGGGMLGVVGQL